MSSTIKQAIQALKARVADAFAAVEAKGGTIPATQDSANLPAAIASIPSGGGSGYTGHLDEVGLSQIGWGEDDLSWFRKLVDWDADADEAMRVPQELIDAYNEYKNEHGGVVDSGFYDLHKGRWYFRYAPVVSSYPWRCLDNAPYMIACPSKFHEYNTEYGAQEALLKSNAFRYAPKITCSVPQNHSYENWMKGKNVYKLVMEGLSSAPLQNITFYYSTFVLLHLTLKTAVVNLQYPPTSATHLFIEAMRIDNMGGGWLSGCKTCYLKGLACSVRLVQPYITKKELLYAINNEASDGTTPYVITLSAGMYSKYVNDADILSALADHSNFALASE